MVIDIDDGMRLGEKRCRIVVDAVGRRAVYSYQDFSRRAQVWRYVAGSRQKTVESWHRVGTIDPNILAKPLQPQKNSQPRADGITVRRSVAGYEDRPPGIVKPVNDFPARRL